MIMKSHNKIRNIILYKHPTINLALPFHYPASLSISPSSVTPIPLASMALSMGFMSAGIGDGGVRG